MADVILDTNVLVDIYLPMKPTKELAAAETQALVTRSRNAVLLGILCHKQALTSLSLLNEPIRALFNNNVDVSRETYRPTLATLIKTVNEFVKPNILGDWAIEMHDETSEVSGNAADDWYLEQATHFKVPLVTSDGTGKRTSRKPKSLTNRARNAGVDVFTPLDYYRECRNQERDDLQWFIDTYAAALEAESGQWRDWLLEVGRYLYVGIFSHADPYHAG